MLKAAGRMLAPAVLLTALTLSPALGYATTFVLLAFAAAATVWWWFGRGSKLTAPPSTTLRAVPLPRKRERTSGAQSHDPSAGNPLPPAGEGDRQSRWRGEPHAPTLLFGLAFILIALSALLSGANLTPLLSFTALVFYHPLSRLFEGPLTRPAADLSPEGEVPFGRDRAAAHLSLWGRGRRAAAGEGALPVLALLGTIVGLITALALHFLFAQPRAGEGAFLTDPYRLAVTTLLLPVLALGALRDRVRLRWLAPIGLAAALIVIALTGSRATLLGLPVLLLVTALCVFRRPAAIIATLAATAALVLAVLFVELPGTARSSLWDTLGHIAQGGPVGDVAIALRLLLYRLGLEQFGTNPLFGHGWSEANMAPILVQLTPEQLSWGKLVHLHNDALQFAVSGGVLGLIAWALILAAPLAGYLALPPETKGPAKLHATLVLVIGYFVLGLPDLMLASPLQLTLYVTLTAAVLGSPRRVI